MSNIIKAQTKSEAMRQMMDVDCIMANTISRRIEIDDRRKAIKAQLKVNPLIKELKALAKEELRLIVAQHEMNGGRKILFTILKKLKVDMPSTPLTRLTEKNETARHLHEA